MVIAASALRAHADWLVRGSTGGAARLTLRGEDARGQDLRAAQLAGAVIDSCNFEGALLDGTTWASAIVTRSSFRDAVFADANLDDARFVDCDFRDADLSDLRRGRGTTARCQFERCDLRGSIWLERSVAGARFVDCQLDLIGGAPRDVAGLEITRPRLSAPDGAVREATAPEVLRYWQSGRFAPGVTAEDKELVRRSLRGRWRKREAYLARGPRPPLPRGVGGVADRWAEPFLPRVDEPVAAARPAASAPIALPEGTPAEVTARQAPGGVVVCRDARSGFGVALPAPDFITAGGRYDDVCFLIARDAQLGIQYRPATGSSPGEGATRIARELSGTEPELLELSGEGILAAALATRRSEGLWFTYAVLAGDDGERGSLAVLTLAFTNDFDPGSSRAIWSAVLGSAWFGPDRAAIPELFPASAWWAPGLPLELSAARPALPRLAGLDEIGHALVLETELLPPTRAVGDARRADVALRLARAGIADAHGIAQTLQTIHDLRGLGAALIDASPAASPAASPEPGAEPPWKVASPPSASAASSAPLAPGPSTSGSTPSSGGSGAVSSFGGSGAAPSLEGSGVVPGFGIGVPSFGIDVPSGGGGAPSSGGGAPSFGDGVPSSGGGRAPSSGDGVPSFGGGRAPSSGGGVPSFGIDVPSFARGGAPSFGGSGGPPSMPVPPPPDPALAALPVQVVSVTPAEAAAHGLPAVGVRVELAGPQVRAHGRGMFGSYVSATSPPGGALRFHVMASDEAGTDAAAIQRAVAAAYPGEIQDWGAPGTLGIAGAARPALAFATRHGMYTVWSCATLVPHARGAVLVVFGGLAADVAAGTAGMTCEQIAAQPELAHAVRTFALIEPAEGVIDAASRRRVITVTAAEAVAAGLPALAMEVDLGDSALDEIAHAERGMYLSLCGRPGAVLTFEVVASDEPRADHAAVQRAAMAHLGLPGLSPGPAGTLAIAGGVRPAVLIEYGSGAFRVSYAATLVPAANGMVLVIFGKSDGPAGAPASCEQIAADTDFAQLVRSLAVTGAP
ncbi:MAG TPA: pentapeptide repeat-containing protein [Kofleriaceae bacterium]|nr:pentapeptide repeat-containing protein [Kofleriaceae bacterium]